MHEKGRLAAALFTFAMPLLTDVHEAVPALEPGAWFTDEATAHRIALTAHRIALLRSTPMAVVVMGVGAVIAVDVVGVGIAVVVRIWIIGVWSGVKWRRGDGSRSKDRAAYDTS